MAAGLIELGEVQSAAALVKSTPGFKVDGRGREGAVLEGIGAAFRVDIRPPGNDNNVLPHTEFGEGGSAAKLVEGEEIQGTTGLLKGPSASKIDIVGPEGAPLQIIGPAAAFLIGQVELFGSRVPASRLGEGAGALVADELPGGQKGAIA